MNLLEHIFIIAKKDIYRLLIFNTPFIENHKQSISHFFNKFPKLNINLLKGFQNSESILFLDTFTTQLKYRFEEKVRDGNNLSRCFRIDSRAHDLMQLTDILLGATVSIKTNKKVEIKNESKTRVIKEFEKQINNTKKTTNACDYFYYID